MEEKTRGKPDIILVRQSIAESVIADGVTFLMVVGIIGIGVVLKSDAMQWIGFILTVITMISKAGGLVKKHTKSPQAAAEWLRDEYGVTAEPIGRKAPPPPFPPQVDTPVRKG